MLLKKMKGWREASPIRKIQHFRKRSLTVLLASAEALPKQAETDQRSTHQSH